MRRHTFDDDVVKAARNGMKRCLAHPAIQDKLVVEHLIVYERQKEVGALLKTQAIERATREVLLELKMNVLYNLKIGADKDIKITKVKVFLESDPRKAAKLVQLYSIDSKAKP
jgi:hypothetical protein